MIEIKTFKDILSDKEFDFVVSDLEKNGWFFTNKSNDNDKYKFWTQRTDNRIVLESLQEKIYTLIKDLFDIEYNVTLVKTHINGQTYGQNGSKHQDFNCSKYYTFVYYAHKKWEIEWGGETYIINPKENVFINSPFPNSGVIFPSNWTHWGAAPNDYLHLRQTIAFSYKIEKLDDNLKDLFL